MELTAYIHPGWAPLIRPAPATRAWMDATPESFAYRCLPLDIANAHGWEVLSPCAFDAVWSGGTGTDSVNIRVDRDAPHGLAPVSLFGQGVLTFHVEAILRTPPGWNLWIGGSPNRAKDGIAALTGVVETDWSPFSFTMNWRFTRSNHWIHFDALEPFCFFFPVERSAIETFDPVFAPLGADPATQERFREWSAARDAFQERMVRDPPATPSARWQKHYYRGVDAAGSSLVDDHRAKLRLKTFDRSAMPDLPVPPLSDPPASTTPPSIDRDTGIQRALAKRDWLLQAQERQRALAPGATRIERRCNMSGEEFLERHYAPSRPAILVGDMEDWPALRRWTPAYLAGHGSTQDGPTLEPLAAELGFLDRFLNRAPPGAMWIAATGEQIPLRHELANVLVAQVVGRTLLRLLPASEVGKLYNESAAVSEIADLDDATLDHSRFPNIAGARAYEIVLEPGEILFVPFGWWQQVTALEFAVSATYTNFLWPNDAGATYPAA